MDWEQIAARIKPDFEVKNQVREETLKVSRRIIRNASVAIRGVHRGDEAKAIELMDEAAEDLKKLKEITRDHPEIYSAGFFMDAQKEYTEARTTYALVRGEGIPDPDELGVEYAPYLNGVGRRWANCAATSWTSSARTRWSGGTSSWPPWTTSTTCWSPSTTPTPSPGACAAPPTGPAPSWSGPAATYHRHPPAQPEERHIPPGGEDRRRQGVAAV